MNLPTTITLVRFPLAIAFPLADGLATRTFIVVLAALSEWMDGRLARARGEVTRTGELLDPIADKTFVLVVLATLTVEGALPLWTLPLLLTRDIGVTAGALFMLARGERTRMPARMPGKVVTWLQFVALGALLLWPRVAVVAAPAIAAAGLFALVDYARAYRRDATHRETGSNTIGNGLR